MVPFLTKRDSRVFSEGGLGTATELLRSRDKRSLARRSRGRRDRGSGETLSGIGAGRLEKTRGERLNTSEERHKTRRVTGR